MFWLMKVLDSTSPGTDGFTLYTHVACGVEDRYNPRNVVFMLDPCNSREFLGRCAFESKSADLG